jgi:hypothetical protein
MYLMYIKQLQQSAQKHDENFSHPSTPKSIDKEGNVCYNNKAVERKRTEVTERRETAKEK